MSASITERVTRAAITGVVAGGVSALFYYQYKATYTNPLNLVNLFIRLTRRIHDPSFRRLAFNFEVVDSGYIPAVGHTHPVAAKIRNDVVHSIRSTLTSSGYMMYDPSPAKAARDTKYNVIGHRHIHSIKDLSSDLPLETGIPSDSAVVTLIDQDFHLPTLNIYGGRPIVIYTLCVDSLSGKGCDSTWYFVDSQVVVEHVKGGACYMQSLYNYSSDQVVIPHTAFCGVVPSFTVYDVHLHHIANSNKMVVFLCPSTTHYVSIAFFKCITFISTGHFIDVPLLSRLDHVERHGHFLLMKCERQGVVGYCIKRNQDQAHDSTVFVPEGVYRALIWASRGVKMLTVAEVERLTRSYGSPILGTDLATVIEFLSIPYEPPNTLNVYMPPSSSHGDLMHDFGKARGEFALEPIVEETGIVLAKNKAAQRSYVEQRMMANINKEVFSDEMKVYAKEYVALLIRVPGKCVPASISDVVQDQRGRLQVARNSREVKFEHIDRNKVKVDLKSEVVVKGGPARGVATVTTSHSLDSGSISRGFKHALRRVPFYMVGKSPLEIADCVRALTEFCVKHKLKVGETDYSKLDETISSDIRSEIFEPTVKRAFAREHHEYVERVLRDDTELDGNVGEIKIKTGSKNNSGSGLTTDVNTVTSPFVVYVAHRIRGLNPRDAFARCGIAFGDDGLSPGGPGGTGFDELCVSVAASIGLKLKYLEHEPGDPLFFLGRLYLSPLTSSVSMALPSKVLRKLPICIGKASEHRAHRLLGFYVTEKHVPVVSDYIEAAARAYKVDLSIMPPDMEALRTKDRDLFHKLKHGPYPYEDADEPLLLDAVCKDLSLSQAEVEELRTKLRAVQTVKDLEGIKIPLPPLEGLDGLHLF